ncbi:RabGAP/TBC, partial [Trichodelitschia bisporula]
DRYGFKKETQHVSAAEYDKWNATYEPYVERRRKKWIHLMRSNDLPTDKPFRFPAKSDKVKRFVRKGIPPEWRGAAWFWYAGGPARMVEQPRLYWNLLDMATEGKLNDVDREHIERDLNRTFPDNIRFKPDTMPEVSDDERPGLMGKQGEPPMISALRRVLQAFAIHNPHVGYCQSLNFIAGLLLLFLDMDEEKSFIMLDIITRDHLPGIHNKTLEDIDMGVLMSYIQESMPAVWSKIDDADDMGGTASAHLVTRRLPTIHLTTTAWFMTCFVGNLPIETVLRVWDSFWFEGSKTLFRIALTLFKAVETNVRALTDHMEIMQTVQAIPRRWIDANSLMEQCFRRRGGFGHVSLDSIQARR